MNRHPNTAPFTQGVFYVATGLWPIIHLRSFERAVGVQPHPSYAKIMGGVAAGIGAALIVGSLESRPSKALRWLGIGSAIAFGLADLLFAARGRGRKVYLADAAAEGAALASWIIAKPRFLH